MCVKNDIITFSFSDSVGALTVVFVLLNKEEEGREREEGREKEEEEEEEEEEEGADFLTGVFPVSFVSTDILLENVTRTGLGKLFITLGEKKITLKYFKST